MLKKEVCRKCIPFHRPEPWNNWNSDDDYAWDVCQTVVCSAVACGSGSSRPRDWDPISTKGTPPEDCFYVLEHALLESKHVE